MGKDTVEQARERAHPEKRDRPERHDPPPLRIVYLELELCRRPRDRGEVRKAGY
jgi:hypothetical protein